MENQTRIIAFANQKGGVSKTTSSLNVAYVLSKEKNKKVLLIDFDSQGSASLNLGLPMQDPEIHSIDEILDLYVSGEIDEYKWEDIQNYIYTPKYEGLVREKTQWKKTMLEYGFDIIPSRLNLALVELKMGIQSAQNGGVINPLYLKKLTDVICENGKYDYIIIDTPPALSSLSICAMMAATSGIIVPSNLDIMSFYGINSFLDSANYVVDFYKKSGLEHRGVLGILLSLYNNRRTIDQSVQKYVKEFYPVCTFTSTIRESTLVKKANASNMLYAMIDKKGYNDFKALVDEIILAIEDRDKFEKLAKENFDEVTKQLDEKEEGENNGEQ